LALASLYTLAKEEGDKAILFTIAIVSQNKELKKTIASLVADDNTASQEFKDKLISKLGRIWTSIAANHQPPIRSLRMLSLLRSSFLSN
jgi:hypothetical protein